MTIEEINRHIARRKVTVDPDLLRDWLHDVFHGVAEAQGIAGAEYESGRWSHAPLRHAVWSAAYTLLGVRHHDIVSATKGIGHVSSAVKAISGIEEQAQVYPPSARLLCAAFQAAQEAMGKQKYMHSLPRRARMAPTP